MRDFVKPTVVVSRCLEFSACRYNGDKLSDQTVCRLKPYVTFVPVCPEIEIGLGTPRETIRLIADGEESKLIQPKTGVDLTAAMTEFSTEFLQEQTDVDGFILKNRSPSCGITDAKVYQSENKSAHVVKTGSGLFTSEILQQYSGVAIEDEGRLKNFRIREHFLTKLFTLAEFKSRKRTMTMDALNEFHKENKYLFMAYNPQLLKKLGQIVGNQKKLPLQFVVEQYEETLVQLFQKAPKYTSNLNVFEHIFGYFSAHLTTQERDYFLSVLEKYREKKLPISSVVSILKLWAHRFNNEYLLNQTFFEPYPESLIDISDSGKGRDYR
ncbi:DUF523 and DUF1722 domain-containing protein [Alkalihalobacillus sp. LMS39]|uniref:YbgA family protein n=1 Tax=Alkalihalobacillus sp. LMS39 TaxID=2924032 RepID=UPI001FB37E06|nr:DUF523 and DUF1722 domain-containing protein [Alkalihalobacillus sp. LMS39]UOE92227.1 DUF523 and DUF1722 domain-containing protein [Alkalihalobacillus sp. LMS39]